MIKFSPEKCEKMDVPYSSENCYSGYVAYDVDNNSEECGKCVFKIQGYNVEIVFTEADGDDPEIVEGLIRSALNYAGNRNAYMAYYKAANGRAVAEKMGFAEEKSVLTGDIPTLLTGSCCKH